MSPKVSLQFWTKWFNIPCTNCLWCYIGETHRAFNTRKKKNIWETSKLQLRVLELPITPGPTTTPLISVESASIINRGSFRTRKTFKRCLPEWHIMQITVLARYLGNATFFLTNIHNYIFYYYVIHCFYSIFLSLSYHNYIFYFYYYVIHGFLFKFFIVFISFFFILFFYLKRR